MKCETCKYWGIPWRNLDYTAEEHFNTKRCGKTVELWNAGTWKKIDNKIEFVLAKEHADQLMFTKDASDCSADLYTKANFFCAHYVGVE